jgi:glyoxylase-like metal-dependent hydrolase (beta-lactamase superfamily II)
MLDRRHALKLTGAAAAALAGPLATTASATSEYRLGSMTARVLSDGFMSVGSDRLVATPRTAQTAAVIDRIGATAGHRFAVNVTLLSAGGRRILIDAGAGGTWVETAGKLSDDLQAASIPAAEIDLVVLTHGHPDHLWGVIDDFDDTLRFPKTRYVVPRPELEFWLTPGRAEALGAAEGIIAGARRVFGRIAERLTPLGAEEEIAPGIAYVAAHGHTPGHCAVLAASGSDSLIVASDTLFHPVVSVEHPDWSPVQDMDPVAAAASRKRLLDLAASKRALVVAYHIDHPGVGLIESSGTGYRWRRP